MFVEDTAINYNIEIFENYLAQNNLRKTPSRISILKSLCKLKQPFSKKDIIEEFAVDDRTKQTAWNTIPILLKSGVIRRIIIDTNEVKVIEKFEVVNLE